ncbi:MAG: hypothetical protein HC886_01490 [Leptolyngbyaceae cyanobacterium SM1_1_3]|nr:hypothetical protein [Leptolyngbyaceae cyanobacterium SM1_1_3]NJN03356.1 hypothetical protein [Leptolyngbyaceae cyanobacterium RM1_1_2]NJO09882.1 hypothetical protein [Leptolyngbyaceae cyanobacterium SL_1_1]
MNQQLIALFDQPEKRYLNPKELSSLSQYVASLPERIRVYRLLRDNEVKLMQQAVDSLQAQCSQISEKQLERSTVTGLLILRYCAMAMVLDDATFVKQRLQGWLSAVQLAYETVKVDQDLHEMLRQQLGRQFTAQQLSLLEPALKASQVLLSQPPEKPQAMVEAAKI